MKIFKHFPIIFTFIAVTVFSISCADDGQNGSNGADGSSMLVTQTELAAGAECEAGGVRIDIGPDANVNGVLDAEEITDTEYVCNGNDGNDGEDLTDISPGTNETFTAYGVSFNMKYVPGNVAFPTGIDDYFEAKKYYAYWIGETEVTYELWYIVREWAEDNGYHFEYEGREGNDGISGEAPTNQKPVTLINWRDAMVWCNALTEWHNEQTGTDFSCVYTYGGIVRDSRDANAESCDNVVENRSATGFRLLSKSEWELAARWRTDATNTEPGYSSPWFTNGNSASGATADYNNSEATGLVAWYNENSDSSVHEVKGKYANSLGLYDMSGNVREWCFTKYYNERVLMGGDYDGGPVHMQLGYSFSEFSYFGYSNYGFRVARTP